MEQDLLVNAIKRLLNLETKDKEDFLHDLELTVSQLYSDVDHELKTLTSLSDTNKDFGPEIDSRMNWLRQVHDAGNIVNSAVENLENQLIDEKLQTSELTDVLAETVQRQEEYFHSAPTCFSDESLNINMRALYEVIKGDNQQICDKEIFANNFKNRTTEVASSDRIHDWTPQFNDELAKAGEVKEVIQAIQDEIAQIDKELEQFAE